MPLSAEQVAVLGPSFSYSGPVTCTSVPWNLAFGGCTFSGNYAGAPLVRSGSCETTDGALWLDGKGITSVPVNAFAGMAKMT